eukprot:SAG31_NODE_4215_length_3457_cov_1.360036_4_plen_230_part_00
MQSVVTAVIELAPAQPQPQAGGLYIKAAQAAEPNFPALRGGDAFLHSYDLLHGVHINCAKEGGQRCSRYSLVLWFQEDVAKCDAGGEVEQAEQMLRRSADAGVAEGRFGWSRFVASRYLDPDPSVSAGVDPPFISKYGGGAAALSQAQVFLEAAASEQNHSEAAMLLHDLFAEAVLPAGRDQRPEVAHIEAERWLRRGQELGNRRALAKGKRFANGGRRGRKKRKNKGD